MTVADRSILTARTAEARGALDVHVREMVLWHFSPETGSPFWLNYASKLSDLWSARGTRDYELDDIMLLKVGRHLRPAPHFKLIIGREEGENRYLEGYRRTFTSLVATSHQGPLALVDGAPTDEDLQLAARVVARYGQGRDADRVTVAVRTPDGVATDMDVVPLRPDGIPEDWRVCAPRRGAGSARSAASGLRRASTGA